MKTVDATTTLKNAEFLSTRENSNVTLFMTKYTSGLVIAYCGCDDIR